MVWKQGTGARKIAVFADPNCGYRKRFERDLQQVKDVTVIPSSSRSSAATRRRRRPTSGA